MTEPTEDSDQSDSDQFYEDRLVETPDSLRNSNPENPSLDLGTEDGDTYLASTKWGVTAEEERLGEPLDLRLSEEEPDVDQGSPVVEDDAAGRIVADDEGARPDVQKDAVANDVGADDGDYSAEEAAIHLIDEP